MSAKTAAPKLQAFASADEVVAEILGDVTRRQEDAQLSPRERKLVQDARKKELERAAKAKAKAAAQADQRAYFLLPVHLRNQITAVAEAAGVPESQVVTFFLYTAMQQFEDFQFIFEPYLHPSASPRYEFELIHPSDNARAKKHLAKFQNSGVKSVSR